ncbi:MAG: hypothetical protein ACI8QI_001932 [Limisphaerales bacterium]|jgi:hypothetical protein
MSTTADIASYLKFTEELEGFPNLGASDRNLAGQA